MLVFEYTYLSLDSVDKIGDHIGEKLLATKPY